MAEKWATVAWHGISLRVPADWSLVGVSGDEKKGYFRADGPIAAVLEVRWSSAMGKEPDLVARCREMLASVERSSKKRKLGFSSRIRPDRGADSVSFNWRGDRIAQGRLAYCRSCDRVILAQVIWSQEEDVSHLSPLILSSLKDHRDDGWTSWGLYGLELAVPPGWRLEKQQLMSGYMALTFKLGPKRMVVQRWGLVSALLGGKGIEDWYRKDVVPDFRGYRVVISGDRIAGHEGLVTAGTSAGVRQAAKRIAYSLTLHSHPDRLTGYAWNCEESNRLYSVWATHTEEEDPALAVRHTIRCH